MAQKPIVSEVLEKFTKEGKVNHREALAATAAAAAFREEFLRDAYAALKFQQPGTPEFFAFKNCILSMGETMSRNGIVSVKDMQDLWVLIEVLG